MSFMAPASPPLPALLNAAQVGQWLDLSERQILRLARRGDIPSIQLPNDDIVFDQVELLMWLDHLKDEPQQQRRNRREVSHG
jgi:hypothetical protein